MQKTAAVVMRFTAVLLLTAAAGGCSNFLRVYKSDLDQGNLVTREMVDKLKPGMTPAQVRYVLGTPTITDTLHPRRWDYVYDYLPGTYARKAGFKEVNNRRLTVYFDDGVLSRIEGADNMPSTIKSLPASRDKGLTAEPL